MSFPTSDEPQVTGDLRIDITPDGEGAVHFNGVNISRYITRMAIMIDPSRPMGEQVGAKLELVVVGAKISGLLEKITVDSSIVHMSELLK